jgi:PAS domain S-box-containing protein
MVELLQGLADAVVSVDGAGRIAFANRAAESLLAWSAGALVGQPIERVFAHAGRTWPCLLEELREGGVARAPVCRRDGVEIEVEVTLGELPDGGRVASLRRRHDALAEAPPDESYRLVFDQAPVAILHFDARGVITACNGRFVALLGSERRLLVGLDMLTLPDVRIVECVRGALAGIPSRFEGDYRAATSGKVTPVHADFNPIVGADGKAAGGVGIIEDISERQATLEALRRSELSFRTLIESAPEAICAFRDGRFIYVNPSMARTLGYDAPEELLGRPVSEVQHPEHGDGFARMVEQLRQQGRPGTREARFVRKDGGVVIAEVELMIIHFDGEEAMVALGRDITERKMLQSRLAQADRMASVGTLAAGVAHEINNPLAYVMASLDLARRKLASLRATSNRGGEATLSQIASSLENAREGAERVSTIVRDLRTFSRDDGARRVLVDVERVLDSTVNMAWNEIRTRARLVKSYGGVSAVWGDESRLGQVFLNLLINAAHAIAEGDPQQNEIRVTTRDAEAGRVTIEVVDTGSGIPPELIGRIFEPFVTTKPIGVGTGLGLSICHGIVTALGGEITVESKLGTGACFRVTLPGRAAGEPAVATTALTRRRILVIDDEPSLARALGDDLARHHEVVVATSGSEAIELLLHDDRFDLVLCDVHMPGMNGPDVYDEIRQIRPGVHERFVFMSGSAVSERTAQRLERLPNARLEKPFTAADIDGLFRKRARKA